MHPRTSASLLSGQGGQGAPTSLEDVIRPVSGSQGWQPSLRGIRKKCRNPAL